MTYKKSFVIRTDYLANYGGADRSRSTSSPVSVSSYPAIKQTLEQIIKANDVAALKKQLRALFIHPNAIRTYSETTRNTFPESPWVSYQMGNGHCVMIPASNYGRGQRDTITYAEHHVAPVLEELLINHKADYIQLLASATPECQRELMDFSTLDLAGSDLTDLDTTNANFTATQLNNVKGLTQDTLDNSLAYDKAALPQHLIPSWTKEKKEHVLKGLGQLKKYGDSLKKSIDPEGRDKGDKATTLADALIKRINTTPKLNGSFQQQFLEDLHQHDSEFSHKRFFGLKMIIANIALCIVGFGLGYLAAGLLHYKQSDRFWFFSRPETEQQIDTIQKSIISPSY